LRRGAEGFSKVPVTRSERPFGSSTLILETGKLAKQAHGAVLVTYGETCVLVAAVEGSPIPGRAAPNIVRRHLLPQLGQTSFPDLPAGYTRSFASSPHWPTVGAGCPPAGVMRGV